jgi:hypothetical protein
MQMPIEAAAFDGVLAVKLADETGISVYGAALALLAGQHLLV